MRPNSRDLGLLVLASCVVACRTEAPPPPPARVIVVEPLARDAKTAPKTLAPRAGERIAFGESKGAKDLAPFFAGTTYDPRVPRPDALLRQPLGTFTAHHDEVLGALRAMAEESDRMRLFPFGTTHEGRELVGVVLASPQNLAKLDAIRADHQKLADPRGIDPVELGLIVKSSPAVAWLGYSIHGDEMSGTDASLAVAYHLAAGTSADVQEILDNVVVVLDPCQNPDGRERILSMLEQSAGYVPNLGGESMARGRWPYGRGNHYLFDMNRDWLWGTQPETRARWGAVRSFHPQLFVDAHEMGAQETFLFYPATDPLTPHFPQYARDWWARYAIDQSAAFDQRGWSYYTREWADSWYPGYSDAWATFQGACGILYEQARYHGQSFRRASGEIATYREAVQRQAAASIANVTTLARNREAALRDSLAAKQRNVAADGPGNDRSFVIVRGRAPTREARLLENLLGQGIEVFETKAEFSARDVDTASGRSKEERKVPAGSWIVPARQPLSPLVQAMLAFDPRYDQASLERERRELERKQSSKIYDVTAWSPALAYDLDALWCANVEVERTLVTSVDAPQGAVVPAAAGTNTLYGWAIDGGDDAAVTFAARALEAGLKLQIGDEPFRAEERSFARGSLLVRRVENAADAPATLARLASETGVLVQAVSSARSRDDGPDLGGTHFELLARPRVALLANAPMDTDSFGHAWHLVDAVLGIPCTLLDAQSFGRHDLRLYNVLVVADPAGDLGHVLAAHKDELATWIEGGGTLIACAGAAAEIASADLGLSSVRQREDALDDLAKHTLAVKREREAGRTKIDVEAIYGAVAPAAKDADAAKDAKPDDAKKTDEKKDDKKPGTDEDAKERDRYLRTFAPRGVFARGEVDLDAWLTYGCNEEMPVFVDGSTSLLARRPVRVPVRLASADRLRLSGLLWPEARERVADSAWCTVERRGAGQVILFAASPAFRGWLAASQRLLANAIVYGPGLGARQPLRD